MFGRGMLIVVRNIMKYTRGRFPGPVPKSAKSAHLAGIVGANPVFALTMPAKTSI
jgi:hypothetical protein